jgi:sialate O-acetylesterase
MNNSFVVLFALTLLLPSTLLAQNKLEYGKTRIDVPAIGNGLCLHNIFQSNMVLQRDKPIRLWGWADPGETISVTFAEKTVTTTTAENRSWKVEFPALPVSCEPRTLVVQGKSSKIELTNILLGDIWLLGGQSNMEFPLSRTEEGPLEIISANFDQIRHLTVPQQNTIGTSLSFPRWYKWGDFLGEHYRQGYWDVCSPDTIAGMSSIGYTFCRRLHMATRVPIGIVNVSLGGSTLVTWTPIDVLKNINDPQVKDLLAEWDKNIAEYDAQKDLQQRIASYNHWVSEMKEQGREIPADRKAPTDLRLGPAHDTNRPGQQYANTLSSISGLSVKGAIWHQGYNESTSQNGHKLYAIVFPETIKAWRKTFNDLEMPFGIITQETQEEPQTLDDYLPYMIDEGNYVREVHYQTFLKLRKAGDKNIGYASCFDLRRSWYHPQIKIPAGERVAKWALATQYGKDIRWLPPQLVDVKSKDGKLYLKLDSNVYPYNDGPIHGFAIAGKDGRFHACKAEFFDKNGGNGRPSHDLTTITLRSPYVHEPVFFRHAWARNPMANLKSAHELADLPFDSQRNDTFSHAEMYENYTGQKTAKPGEMNSRERNILIQALRDDDKKRRVDDAKALIETK